METQTCTASLLCGRLSCSWRQSEVCSQLGSRALTDKRDGKRISKILYENLLLEKLRWGGRRLLSENTGGYFGVERHQITKVVSVEMSLSPTIPSPSTKSGISKYLTSESSEKCYVFILEKHCITAGHFAVICSPKKYSGGGGPNPLEIKAICIPY